MLIFILQGYLLKTDEGRLEDVITVELYGETYPEVLERAKKIVDKPFWRLQSVIEKHGST